MTFSRSISMIISLVFLCSTVIGQTTSVLFLGNSYTYSNDLPGTLYNLALAAGDTIYSESNTPGGYTFSGHSTNSTSLDKISSREWDFVVLQEQSQIPSFHPTQVASQCYPYATILVDSVRSNYECSEPLFFMTWGRRDGDQSNCQNYTPLCTYDGMQARLRESYLEMSVDNNASVAPCGAAWKQLEMTDSLMWRSLYSGDGSHPSAFGTYLNACVFYASIFRQSPVGLDYYSSVGQASAEILQQLAEDVVLDSLDNWRIGHADVEAVAEFSFDTGLTVNFSGSSSNADQHYWEFGDGLSSNEQNPSHTYPSAGNYAVTYYGINGCDSDTSYLNVLISPFTSVDNPSIMENVQVWSSVHGINLRNGLSESVNFKVRDLAGKLIEAHVVGANQTLLSSTTLLSGIYLLQANYQNASKTFRVFIY